MGVFFAEGKKMKKKWWIGGSGYVDGISIVALAVFCFVASA